MTDVITTRISALEHIRQFVGMLAGILAGLCALLATSEQIRTWFTDNLVADGQLFAPFVLVRLTISELLFLMGVLLLTDSIHNYSKVLEYEEPRLFDNEHRYKGNESHVSALAADDLSYWCIRLGTVTLFWIILLVALRLMVGPIHGLSVCCQLALIASPLVVSFLSVFFCYRVSHCHPEQDGWWKSLWKFIWPFRYKDAAKKSRGWCQSPHKNLSKANQSHILPGN